MAAGSIVVELLMRTGSFETDTARAGKSLKGFQSQVESIGKAIGISLGATVVGAASALVAMVKQQAKAIDEFNDLKDATGASIENISALDRVARETGVSFDTVGTSLIKFNKALGDAKAGDDATRVFEALGLSVEDLKRLDPAEALRQTAVAFSKFADDGSKARAAQILFGKSLREVAPFLKDLADKTELVGKVSTAAAEEAEKFNKELYKLQANSADSARSLTLNIVTAINKTIEAFRNGAKAGEGFFETLRNEQLKLLGIDVRAEESEASRVERVKALTKILENQNLPVERRIRLEKQLADLQAKSFANFPNVAGGGRGVVNPPLATPSLNIPDRPDKEAKQKRVQSEAERYLESLQKQIEKTSDLTAEEQALTDIQQKRLEGITPALEAQILAEARLLDQTKAAKEARDAQVATTTKLAQARLAELETLGKGNEGLQKEIELLGLDEEGKRAVELQAVRVAKAEKELTLSRLEAKGVSEQQLQVLQQEVELLKERESLLSERNDKAADIAATEAAKKAGDAYKDQLGNSIEQGILDGFRRGQSLTDIFLNELKAQFAKTILRPLIQPAVDSGNNAISSIIGAAAGFFGSSGGTVDYNAPNYGNVYGRPRGGGATGSNNLERDMIMLVHKGESIVPKAYNPAAGGTGRATIINLTNQGGQQLTAREESRQETDQATIVNLVLNAVANDVQRGGRTHRAISGQYGLSRAAGAPKMG